MLIGFASFPLVIKAQNSSQESVPLLVEEVTRDLKENILPFWEKNAPDPRGGFYGTILNDGTPQPDYLMIIFYCKL
ncbi:MAG TPA: hypothetical protein PLN06_08665 [Bacteroidales bacterium]|nr:hypothetical protein [Bacteroidales bacterium]HOU96679.1 hypothetical protein [Bacteroidales bacterium]HQG52443.1 hypothetical protein [Bacteroidales bacterium]HQJ21504.1 hypothetical protein [Bacteroidales bacterium]HRC90217.1 hypothetical protein [Bacteroidales bacterium]